jgi:hypothetical protein
MPKKPPFLYGRGRCIFCQEYGVSQEHVFGLWLREIFPRDERTTHTRGVVEWAEIATPDQPSVFTKTGQGHSGSKKVRVVCRRCNETWLSNDVEEAAKPILLPLIAGKSGTLTLPMQRILALWAAKTAMTSAHINRKAVFLQHEYSWLMKYQTPPPGWFISASPYSGEEWRELGVFQHSGKLEVPTVNHSHPAENNLVLTFIGMGHLLLTIQSSTWTRLFPLIGDRIKGAPRICPPSRQSFDWPAPYVFSDVETKYLTTHLARILNQRV